VCSFINSNYNGFGSGIVAKDWGFSLQNRGHNFYAGPDLTHPNLVGPEKRSYHTIIPALVTHAKSGEWYAGMGVMGAFMQPQGHLQTFLSLFEGGLTPQEALDKCRFCIDIEREGGVVLIEEGTDEALIEALRSMKHQVKVVKSWDRKVFGRGQIIIRDENKVLQGGCDPRSDGLTLGH
jgi:gamma-glutamyltranspeptidase/glutathione hydrolase